LEQQLEEAVSNPKNDSKQLQNESNIHLYLCGTFIVHEEDYRKLKIGGVVHEMS